MEELVCLNLLIAIVFFFSVFVHDHLNGDGWDMSKFRYSKSTCFFSS